MTVLVIGSRRNSDLVVIGHRKMSSWLRALLKLVVYVIQPSRLSQSSRLERGRFVCGNKSTTVLKLDVSEKKHLIRMEK